MFLSFKANLRNCISSNVISFYYQIKKALPAQPQLNSTIAFLWTKMQYLVDFSHLFSFSNLNPVGLDLYFLLILSILAYSSHLVLYSCTVIFKWRWDFWPIPWIIFHSDDGFVVIHVSLVPCSCKQWHTFWEGLTAELNQVKWFICLNP